MKILYLEDDLEIRENYKFILETYFCETHAAKNIEEAMDFYKKNTYNLLLLDINIEEDKKSGLDFAEFVRKNNKNIKIIMLTAYSDRERLLQAVGLKLDNYLIKPIDNDTLIKTIRENLEKTISTKNSNRLVVYNSLIWFKDKEILEYKNKTVKLTKKEKILISYLSKHQNSYVEKDNLIVHLWEDDIPDFTHNQKLTQVIYRLNKKIMLLLKKDINIIENHYSIGYRLSSV